MSTIPEVFTRSVRRFGSRPALIEPRTGDEITRLTFDMLQEQMYRFAGYLQQQNLNKGQRIMIWSPSRIDWLISYFAAQFLGLVVVPLDVNSKEDFLRQLATVTEATYIITTKKLYETLQNPPLPLIDIDALPEAPLDISKLPELNEHDLAELVFTSGTTGQPKGVMLSHRNIVSNAIAAVEVVQITAEDRALSILPLSHMFEMTIEIALMHAGASIVYARSLSPDTLFRLLATQNITCMVLVPQALQLFINGIEREVRRQRKEKQWEILHKIAVRLPFSARRYLFGMIHKRFGSHFRLFVCGGAHLQLQLGRRWEQMGFRVLHGYGATECAPVISVNPVNDHNLASVGKPLPGVEVRIGPGEEIQVRGSNVALGYWQNPTATAAAFHNGWYDTGDLGYLDKRQNLYLKGRKKNLIVLPNGMNVYPEDIENFLLNAEEIKDAVVLGLEDAKQGLSVHAVLLLEDPTQATYAKSVIQRINKRLASHQQIRGFTIWSEEDFPRTHTLKVKRHDVEKILYHLRAEKK
ncbi:MAG TPA: AMP-binding protein [Dictyobacter sp.]|jgi:long-chain acyl-CoA synthetase|nr:AMP-binding protein [Dictyobacter sp.]